MSDVLENIWSYKAVANLRCHPVAFLEAEGNHEKITRDVLCSNRDPKWNLPCRIQVTNAPSSLGIAQHEAPRYSAVYSAESQHVAASAGFKINLKMKAMCCCETSTDFQRTTRRYIQEDRILLTTTVRTSNPT
jgi:hypothetical protein